MKNCNHVYLPIEIIRSDGSERTVRINQVVKMQIKVISSGKQINLKSSNLSNYFSPQFVKLLNFMSLGWKMMSGNLAKHDWRLMWILVLSCSYGCDFYNRIPRSEERIFSLLNVTNIESS